MSINTNSIDLERNSSQYLSIGYGSQTGLAITGDITMEAWVKLETLPSTTVQSMVFASNFLQNGINRFGYSFVVYGGVDSVGLQFFDGVGTGGTSIRTLNPFFTIGDVGQWVHMSISADVSARDVKVYRNSTSLTMNDLGGTDTSIGDGNSTFYIGVQSGIGSYVDGKMDEIRIWDVVRTPTEIADNYNKQLIGNETNLQGYWRLNNNLLDETSNNNDLTNNNSATFSTDVPFIGTTFKPKTIIF